MDSWALVSSALFCVYRPHPRPVGHPLSINGDGGQDARVAGVIDMARGKDARGAGVIDLARGSDICLWQM